jgi:hypothetical protein
MDKLGSKTFIFADSGQVQFQSTQLCLQLLHVLRCAMLLSNAVGAYGIF